MGLSSNDKKPTNISLSDAYTAVRTWYLANFGKLTGHKDGYANHSLALIKALPSSPSSTLEARAVLGEVVYGNLEWAYHESDGSYKMGAYAHAALDAASGRFWLSEAEQQQVTQSSAIASHFSFNQR